ncbi:MAG: hypothetical protein VX278_11540 [Myxococcota bacterium]|nr:hypothetical protein [Myxococcota bacterium]
MFIVASYRLCDRCDIKRVHLEDAHSIACVGASFYQIGFLRARYTQKTTSSASPPTIARIGVAHTVFFDLTYSFSS